MSPTPLRVGVAVLDCDQGAEADLRRLLPDEVDVFVTRVPYLSADASSLADAEASLQPAVALLRPVRPHAVVWACTASSANAGTEGRRRLREQLMSWSGAADAWTAMDAVLAHLDMLGAERLAVGSPYAATSHDVLLGVLADAGLDVVHTARLRGAARPRQLQDVSASALLDFACSLAVTQADTVFVSCTALRTAALDATVRSSTGKRFTSSNIAIAAVLRRVAESENSLRTDEPLSR